MCLVSVSPRTSPRFLRAFDALDFSLTSYDGYDGVPDGKSWNIGLTKFFSVFLQLQIVLKELKVHFKLTEGTDVISLLADSITVIC